ncbi:hypothetical protein C0J52_11889 [Blattella germanica]|nr:hypothetical protein C0J52_11889 [Blattella germanica]
MNDYCHFQSNCSHFRFCVVLLARLEGPGASSFLLSLSSLLDALDELSLLLTHSSDSVSSSENSLYSQALSKTLSNIFLSSASLSPLHLLATMLAIKLSEKIQTKKLFFSLDKVHLFESQTGEFQSHMSALHFRMNTNAIYELETKLHTYIYTKQCAA